jgi:hypothetical protein
MYGLQARSQKDKLFRHARFNIHHSHLPPAIMLLSCDFEKALPPCAGGVSNQMKMLPKDDDSLK